MSERLTERLENGGVRFSNGEYWNTVYPQNENCLTDIHRMAIKLCDLEDKIERGKIVELPCKIGHTVYCIRYDKARKPFVKPLGVCSVAVWGKGGFTVFTTKEDSWGVTAFATIEEAEAKLREMEGER